jgi:phosphatidylinositol-3-phosphatase
MTAERCGRGLVAIAALVAALVLARPGAPSPPAPVPRLAHAVVIVFENHERASVLGSSLAPTFNHLASTYAQATAYYGVAHPSLPNYLAMVSGSTHGVTSDCTMCPQAGPTIGSQLSAKHLGWAAYAEGYPGSSGFAKKHVPFLYFPGGASHVLPLRQFDVHTLPAYSLVVPDLCHDMHDCSIAVGDTWLRSFIAPLLTVTNTAIFIVFDEGTTDTRGGGHVLLIVAGTAVRRHAVFTTPTSHYGLLRTIEASLGVAPLGLARSTPLLTGIWRS